MKKIYLFLGLIFIFLSVWSQSTKRFWNYHLSKVRTLDVVKGNAKVYFLSEGGIYYFSEADETSEAQILTKIDGLSGSDFQGIDYNHNTNSLVVTYKSSMVDVVNQDGTIHPFPEIKRKNISGSKTIFNATCHDKYCYLSCGFGIVVIDLVKLEIKDSFIIGNEGMFQPVYDVLVDTAYIFAGTDDGLKYAPLNSPNLLDYSNWKLVDNIFLNGHAIHKLINTWNHRIYAIHKSDLWHGDKIFSRHTAELWYPEYPGTGVVYDISFSGDKTILCSINGVQVFQDEKGEIENIDAYPFKRDSLEMKPLAAVMTSNGDLWIADNNYGALRMRNGVLHRLSPDGPIDNDVFAMAYSNNKLWVAGGGRDMSWNNLWKHFVIQSYSNGKWDYVDSFSDTKLRNSADVVQVLPSLSDPNHVYVATWGGGIYEFQNNILKNTYNESNSTLQNAIPGKYYVRIGGMDFDSQGNLWASNSDVENNLHVRRANGTWQSFSTPDISLKYKIGPIAIDDYDNVWTIVPREKTNGLYVMSNDGKKKTHLDVKSFFSNSEESITSDMNNVFCIKKDLKGNIWVGTSKGVAVYSDPENVFTTKPYYATQPGVDENDGYYHPLLANQSVLSIAVDGGNRKWLGTKSSGIYLVSEDGKKEIEHYTTDNSELISNTILSMAYNGDDGILYVGTDLGLVSFNTQSRKAFSGFKNIYAYPNPVRSGFQGDIFITGLMENTNVKITTVSGRLVYETTSLGGQAVWNGSDLAGNRVHSGVYIVFCVSEDGAESAVTKIAFIR